MAEHAGADALGVVVCSDSPRNVSLERAEEIFREVGPFITKVCVSHTESPDEFRSILEIHPSAVQVSYPHPVPEGRGRHMLRVIGPGAPLPDDCSAVVIDASRGSGRPYDPVFARAAVLRSPVPVILAGGLNPGNVGAAVENIRPYAVDAASGLEKSPGIKDPGLVRQFIRNARGNGNARS